MILEIRFFDFFATEISHQMENVEKNRFSEWNFGLSRKASNYQTNYVKKILHFCTIPYILASSFVKFPRGTEEIPLDVEQLNSYWTKNDVTWTPGQCRVTRHNERAMHLLSGPENFIPPRASLIRNISIQPVLIRSLLGQFRINRRSCTTKYDFFEKKNDGVSYRVEFRAGDRRVIKESVAAINHDLMRLCVIIVRMHVAALSFLIMRAWLLTSYCL